MSQNNEDLPDEQWQGSGIVVGNSGNSQNVAEPAQGAYGAPPYGYDVGQPFDGSGYTEQRQPDFDSVEFAKITPQILVLLVLTGLKRNWKWAVPTAFTLAAVAFGTLYFLFPIKFEAKAWIQILSRKPHFIFSETEQRQYKNLVQTQFSIIRSPLIIDRALENPKVANLACVLREKDKPGWLGKSIRLNASNNSELINISIETDDAAASEIIVNGVVDAYLEYIETQSQDWNTKLLTQLTLELSRHQATARFLQDEIRSKMAEAAQKGGSANTEGGIGGGFVQGESLQRDLYLAESKLDSLTAEKKMLQEMIGDSSRHGLPPAMLSNIIANDPVIGRLQDMRSQLEEQLASQREVIVRKDDPKIFSLNERINKISKQMEERRNSLMENSSGDMQRIMIADMEQKIWTKDMDIRAMQIYVDNLRDRFKDQIKNVDDRTTKIVDVSFQSDQLKRINGVLDLLSTRVVTLQTEMHAPPQIQLRKKATVPFSPSDKKRIPLALIGAAGCFCMPFFIGIAIERLKPRLYHISQIRRSLSDVALGEILEPPVAWVRGTSFRRRLARYRESVNSWCTHLLLSDPFRSCRTIAIASVAGDDGKTFLAIQIAIAMSQMKSGPVLLIDGDMRVGHLHTLFGNDEPGIGLADVLSFRNGFGEAVVLNENEPNLHLLSAGNLDMSPYELLGDGRFHELLRALKNYSLILTVVPPVSHAAESLMMSASCDSTLLCVRQGETVLAAMEDVYRKLIRTGSHVDGIVVKDIPHYQTAGRDGGFADKLEQIRLSHLLQYSE
ncbi:MAG: hypothetical protein FWE67_06445 [Planctomycetaceae bacterium]|nr:hypothetical protein [Planctomycetaceae bacterium]